MPNKLNCWEFKNCGREPGGAKIAELGMCPASIDNTYNGLNGGKNAGRICWAVAGTFCGGNVQGTFAQKQSSCIICEFMQQVKSIEGINEFLYLKPGQEFKAHT